MGLFVLAALLGYQPAPSPNRILILQEAQARVISRSALTDQPVKLQPAAAQREMSVHERQELREALERFIQERPGQLVDLR